MSDVRKLSNEQLKDYIEIVTNAYPGFTNPSLEAKETMLHRFIKRQEQDESIDFLGLFRNNQLLGGMRLHYYHMNLFSKLISVGGVGLVAVDLLHKKEKVAKELIESFLGFFLEKGVNMVLLYPFRPDFYKKMGFGFGPKMHQYRISPKSFPNSSNPSNLRMITSEDKEKVRECYTRHAKLTHGMFLKTDAELDGMFNHPENRLIGWEQEQQLKGYMMFSFEKRSPTNFIDNDLVIKEFIFENPEALLELSSFLHRQADQINRIIWNTQEENIHFLIDDPRNGSNNLLPSVYHESNLSGVGLMYRVINIRGLFEELKEHNFNFFTTKLKLNLLDTMLPENNVGLILHFTDGAVEVVEDGDYQAEITLDVADFSSLIMGVISLKELYLYGRAQVSEPNEIDTLNLLFYTIEKPRCITGF